MLRFVVMAGVVAGAALVAPAVAPRLLSAIVPGGPADQPMPPAEPVAVAAAVTPAPSEAVMATLPAKESRRVSIPANRDGHFVVTAVLNGRAVEAMIDTGATSVALTEATARRMGIFPRRDQFDLPVATANGVVRAAPVLVREVRIGGIVVRNVKAVVVPGAALSIDLLGMTFLNRLAKFESARGRLLLIE